MIEKFKNLGLKGQIITVLVVLVIVYFLSKKAKGGLKKTVKNISYNVRGAKNTDGTKNNEISDQRKSELISLAKELKKEIYAIFGLPERPLIAINALPDNEFVFLSEYYNDEYGNAFYDVDWEFMPATDADDDFLIRYEKLGLPKK